MPHRTSLVASCAGHAAAVRLSGCEGQLGFAFEPILDLQQCEPPRSHSRLHHAGVSSRGRRYCRCSRPRRQRDHHPGNAAASLAAASAGLLPHHGAPQPSGRPGYRAQAAIFPAPLPSSADFVPCLYERRVRQVDSTVGRAAAWRSSVTTPKKGVVSHTETQGVAWSSQTAVDAGVTATAHCRARLTRRVHIQLGSDGLSPRHRPAIHLWSIGAEPFPWAAPPPANLASSATPAAFMAAAKEAGVAGALVVQPANHMYDHSYVTKALKEAPDFSEDGACQPGAAVR